MTHENIFSKFRIIGENAIHTDFYHMVDIGFFIHRPHMNAPTSPMLSFYQNYSCIHEVRMDHRRGCSQHKK